MIPVSSHFQVLLRRLALMSLLAVSVVASTGCAWLQDWRDENKGIQLQSLKVPAGYRVAVLARDLPKARHLVMGSRGTLFVGSTAGNIYALTMNGSTVSQQQIGRAHV